MKPSWSGGVMFQNSRSTVRETSRIGPPRGRYSLLMEKPWQVREFQGKSEGRLEFRLLCFKSSSFVLSEDRLRLGFSDLAEGGDSSDVVLLCCSYFHFFSRPFIQNSQDRCYSFSCCFISLSFDLTLFFLFKSYLL